MKKNMSLMQKEVKKTVKSFITKGKKIKAGRKKRERLLKKLKTKEEHIK